MRQGNCIKPISWTHNNFKALGPKFYSQECMSQQSEPYQLEI